MKNITGKSMAQPGTLGPFDILRVLPNSTQDSVGPVIFLEHIPATEFAPDEFPAHDGSFAHPHRGIATFTYLLSGELNHFDSHSGHGHVRDGGIQWMNAGNGIIHDETATDAFREQGGTFHGVQFWVNLPGKHKAQSPDYMPVESEQLPLIHLPDGVGTLKVLLGQYANAHSPIPAFTEQFIWHITLKSGQKTCLQTTTGHEYGGYILNGSASVNGTHTSENEFLVFDSKYEGICIENPTSDALDILIFGGEPYKEPVISHGPFVMNSLLEIQQSYDDYYLGKYGTIDYSTASDTPPEPVSGTL